MSWCLGKEYRNEVCTWFPGETLGILPPAQRSPFLPLSLPLPLLLSFTCLPRPLLLLFCDQMKKNKYIKMLFRETSQAAYQSSHRMAPFARAGSRSQCWAPCTCRPRFSGSDPVPTPLHGAVWSVHSLGAQTPAQLGPGAFLREAALLLGDAGRCCRDR